MHRKEDIQTPGEWFDIPLTTTFMNMDISKFGVLVSGLRTKY